MARGKRAPREPSIVGSFSLQPSQEFVESSVVQSICHLVRKAAQTLLAVSGEAAQNGSRRATIAGERTGVGLLRRGPGAASERGYPMSDRQIDPFNKGGVQPPRRGSEVLSKRAV